MPFHLSKVHESEYPQVVGVWETSVRATHHFLEEEDIQFFKPLLLNQYLKAVDLVAARNEKGRIVGFLGVAENKIEMLFVHPDFIGKGVGKVLLNHALKNLSATKVDVNEDNERAVKFYKSFGFKTISRSELDPTGNPFPILHMERIS